MPRAMPPMPPPAYAKDAYENSGDTLRDGSQAVAKKVQDNPLGALLVAGGIGFALALLMTRPPRRRRRRAGGIKAETLVIRPGLHPEERRIAASRRLSATVLHGFGRAMRAASLTRI